MEIEDKSMRIGGSRKLQMSKSQYKAKDEDGWKYQMESK